MKIQKYIIAIFLVFGIMLGNSCVVVQTKQNKGLHKGWHKTKGKPHSHDHLKHKKDHTDQKDDKDHEKREKKK